uniref:GRB2-associated-binding protein 1-like n=1 Tax=Hippocampus comes TaxID=109280 RepID=A0A3Q2XKL0_HIPCM
MSGAAEVVCEGWLRKSPPEKKLRRYAWKRRWFVLRSGRLSGEPDVLQYYKNPNSRRPIGTINLNLCEQVDAGLSFTKKELEKSFVFDLKTEERTWYLVAESEDDMNRWVAAICLLCGFNPTEGQKHSLDFHLRPVAIPVYDAAPSGGYQVPRLASGPQPSEASVHRQEVNYVPMTPVAARPPASADPVSFGRQVPPPAHTGFRSTALTPATPPAPPIRRSAVGGGEREALPPPIHRDLKPRRSGKPAPLNLPPVQQEWQEVPPPVRSPVTRTFTRDPPGRHSARPTSSHSSSPSSDSDDPDDSYVAMTTSGLSFSAGEPVNNAFLHLLLAMDSSPLFHFIFFLPVCPQSLRLMLHRASEGGASSPLARRARGNKQVEYLDLDLHTGRSTPPRQVTCARAVRVRVDYVVVDPKRTKALRSTREAWHDGRMSTEKCKEHS